MAAVGLVSSAGSPSKIAQLLGSAFAPSDIASLCFFRIGFGWMMAWWAWDYLASGRVARIYIEPRVHFTYYPLDFVRPLPGSGMYAVFVALCLLALGIALGFWYRVASVLFAALFTYVFLIEATNYQNHYYLVILLSWTLALIPAHRAASFDALRNPSLRSDTIAAWALWLVRFHLALPYVFGGIAKLNADWLAGEPARQILAERESLPLIGSLLTQEMTVWLVVYGGLLFDLLIVPLLLWRPTRATAYAVCIFFHVCNAVLFQIHIFPWFMIFASTMFFDPGWPRRVLGGDSLELPPPRPLPFGSLSWPRRIVIALLAAYCMFQVAWPLRHYLYRGDANWTEQGHFFSWRMMLRLKDSALRYYLTDVKSGESWNVNLREYVNAEQFTRLSRDPEMILQLAHYLADEYRGGADEAIEVRALVLTSLNGRKPQLLIDPAIDLAKEPRGFYQRPWIVPLTEPLRRHPWSVPLAEWEQHVKLPPLPKVGLPRRAEARQPPSN